MSNEAAFGLKKGILLIAKNEMYAYKIDPVNVDRLQFIKIDKGTCAMFLSRQENMTTKFAENYLTSMGKASIYKFLVNDKIVWQAWYHKFFIDKNPINEFEFFFDYWKL